MAAPEDPNLGIKIRLKIIFKIMVIERNTARLLASPR
jgi:hypothetical protein